MPAFSNPKTARPHRIRPKWARQSKRSMIDRRSRDWVQISVTALPGLAAVAALIFTALSIQATNTQLQITEQGQITDRYNTAISNIGSSSVDVRLGGIYSLQGIMQVSASDQASVVAILCAFVRDHASIIKLEPGQPVGSAPKSSEGQSDVVAALGVIADRNTAHDGSNTSIDLHDTVLYGADFVGAHLAGANLTGALFPDDLAGADLSDANLSGASLEGANLTNADLAGANLSDAGARGANLTNANLSDVIGLKRALNF